MAKSNSEKFDELVAKRLKLKQTLEDNGSAEGLHRLLTDLYPDTAHFVYELLQNAEDTKATEVEFILRTDGVYFAHNGKRDFTYADVDAITNIGANQGKKGDSTSIGEFGVGFKAVFAYTQTPEIHSGDFHFQILEHFLPRRDGVRQEFLKHEKGWTEFYLPFDNQSKSPSKAFIETKAGLKVLRGNTLLFLRNIKTVRYQIGDSGNAYTIQRSQLRNHRCTLEESDSATGPVASSTYLKYEKMYSYKSERGKQKDLPLGIAFEIQRNNGSMEIKRSSQGRAFVFFPLEKESSHLGFHINAPFSTTVARDSIRNVEENSRIIDELSELFASALEDINKQKLMGASLYETLPNSSDPISFISTPLYKRAIKEFQNHPYLTAKDGAAINAVSAITGPADITELLDRQMLYRFVKFSGQWILPVANNARAEAFLNDLELRNFSYQNFAQAFCDPSRRQELVGKLHHSDRNWTFLFYEVVNSALTSLPTSRGSRWQYRRRSVGDYALRKHFVQSLADCPSIRCKDGEYRYPRECYLLPKGTASKGTDVPLVDGALLSGRYDISKFTSDKLRELLKTIGVAVYDFDARLQLIVHEYENADAEASLQSSESLDAHFSQMNDILKAFSNGLEANYAEAKIFIGICPDGSRRLCTPHELTIGDAYGNKNGDAIAQFISRPLLDPIYRNRFGVQRTKQLKQLLLHYGAYSELKIEETPIEDHPQYGTLSAVKGNETARAVKRDYNIAGLPSGLSQPSDEISFAIWKLLAAQDDDATYAKAEYQKNHSARHYTEESSLIIHLKQSTWIPDKDGVFRRPAEIALADLPPKYRRIAKGALIEAIGIDSDASERAKKEKIIREQVKELNAHLLSEAEYEEFLQLRELKQRIDAKPKKKSVKTADELFSSQPIPSTPALDIVREDSCPVPNVQRRSGKVGEQFDQAIEQPASRSTRIVASYSADNKTERTQLSHWYHGSCQICGTRILGRNGKPIFTASNIIQTNLLDDNVRSTMGSCWNTLSLCPNCAAKLRRCANDISTLPNQIRDAKIIDRDEDPFFFDIVLAEEPAKIRLVPKHVLAMQTCLERLEEYLAKGEAEEGVQD